MLSVMADYAKGQCVVGEGHTRIEEFRGFIHSIFKNQFG
jgi:hypothetical protein